MTKLFFTANPSDAVTETEITNGEGERGTERHLVIQSQRSKDIKLLGGNLL